MIVHKMEAEVSTPRRTLVRRLVPLAITPRRSPRLLAKRLANQHDKPDNQLSPRQVVPLPGVTGNDLGTAPFEEIVSFLHRKYFLLQANIVTAITDGKSKQYVLAIRITFQNKKQFTSFFYFEGRFLRSGAGFLCLTLASGTCRRHQRTRG